MARKPTDEFKANPIWERQAWDTDKSYEYFRQFYLEVPATERSMRDSYRRYRESIGAPKQNTPQPSGTWVNYFNGADSSGRKKKGSLYEHSRTWAQRANAYDDNERAIREQVDREIWIERRRKVRDEEWEIGDKLRARAVEMMRYNLFERTIDTATGVTIFKPTNWGERDIISTFDMALKLQRRAAEMEQGKITVEHDWKKQLEESGIDAGDLFDKLVNEIANGMVIGSDAGSEE